jgi:hypothetical protein
MTDVHHLPRVELDVLAAEPGVTPQAVRREGRFRAARRCIDAPAMELSAVPGAASYELLVRPLGLGDGGWRLRSAEPRVDLGSIWTEAPLAMLQLQPLARDGEGRLIGVGSCTTLVRSPDWAGSDGRTLDYRDAAGGVVEHLLHRAPPALAHPGDPAFMWHASLSVAEPAKYHDFQFPALTYASFIDLFLAGAEAGVAGVDGLSMARRLCDFLIEHPAVDGGPLAGVPFSTMGGGGGGGMWEKDTTTVVRLGWLGCSALRLARASGEDRYEAYARRLAEVLLSLQQEDGSWPYRVRLEDGEVVEPYTAAAVIAILLLERLGTAGGDLGARCAAAVERGTEWVVANPVRTGLWQQMYEDVTTREPYTNLEQWAALETAMLLIRRRHPDALEHASRLIRYVEDQFVIFGPEPMLTPTAYEPLTPSVIEQYVCYWPMDFHTANYVRATLAMHEASGIGVWLDKAVASANTIVRCRLPDGRFSSIVPDRRLGVSPEFPAWYNCMAHAAMVLLEVGPRLCRAVDAAG